MKPVRTNFKSSFGFLILITVGLLFASEEVANEKAMAKILENKGDGFVNVRGERRGFLEKEGVLKQRIKLYSKQEYLAIAAGDEDVEKIVLVVKDKKGNEVARSTETDSTASIKYIPPKKDKYSFFIEAPGKGGYYQFSLVTK